MRSITYLISVLISLILMSLCSCITQSKIIHNNYGKFYSSSGSFRMNEVVFNDKEKHVIYISDNIIAIYYEDSYRNIVVEVEPRLQSRGRRSYDMVCANEMFTLSSRTSNFYISKINEEGIPQQPYIIFYNLKEIKR